MRAKHRATSGINEESESVVDSNPRVSALTAGRRVWPRVGRRDTRAARRAVTCPPLPTGVRPLCGIVRVHPFRRRRSRRQLEENHSLETPGTRSSSRKTGEGGWSSSRWLSSRKFTGSKKTRTMTGRTGGHQASDYTPATDIPDKHTRMNRR